MWLINELKALPAGTKDLRNFSWVLGSALAALGAYAWYRGSAAALWLAGAAAVLLIFGSLMPRALKPVYYIWMSLALVMGTIMTRVILTLLFLLILTPTALIMKLAGRDPLHRRPDPKVDSYWIPKSYTTDDRSRYHKYY